MVASPPLLNDPADERLETVLADYLRAVESGRAPDRMELVARHPDLAPELAAFFAGQERFARIAEPLREAIAVAHESAVEDKLGEGGRLGDFRLLREIGRGGMGVVYEAEQISLNRRVAVKVLPFASTLDQRQLQRFRNEAQAAAGLQHQNIVPVYFVGKERGVHFYAMQYVEGQTLAGIIASLRQASGGPLAPIPVLEPTQDYAPHELPRQPEGARAPLGESSRESSLPIHRSTAVAQTTDHTLHSRDFFCTVARIGIQAADALEHAHSMGIIHRDVKPANLLIDDDRGNVWLTDFGLAQFHAEPGVTQSGDLLGTLRYMSPEQAGAQRVLIDQRTDVYSLGATLYEFLTLRPIFDGADRQTLLNQIAREEPRPPRAIDRSIPLELETIVLKAVSKVPAERYATARDFAEDLHRFLRHEPIKARRPTLPQRVQKWLRRHPSFLGAAVVLLVLLTAGSLLSAWLIHSEQEKTRLALVAERQRAREAEERFQLARRAVDEMIKLDEEELADQPHLQGLRKRLLEAALAYYQDFIEQRRDDPGAQKELAATRDRVKKIVDDLAVLQGAGRLFLLRDKAVLDDLDVNNEQRRSVDDLTKRQEERWQKSIGAFLKLPSEERNKQFLETARANENAVAEILKPEQVRRLRQIALQCQGPMAFRDPEVARELKLTTVQRSQIRSIEAETFFVRWEKPRGSPGSEDGRKAHELKVKEAKERIIETVLKDDQRERWSEMIGKPFRGPMRPFFQGPPGSFGQRPAPKGPDVRKGS